MSADSAFGQMMAENFGSFDLSFFAAFSNLQNDFLNAVAQTLGCLGNFAFLFLLGLFSIFLMMFKRFRKIGFLLAFGIIFMAFLSKYILNPYFGRLRPYIALQANADYFSWYLNAGQVMESEYCFPSKHSCAVFTIATILFIYFGIEKKKWASALFFVPALLIAFSRVYLMVHYSTDVFAGIAIGLLCGLFTYFIWIILSYFCRKSSKIVALNNKLNLEILYVNKFGSSISKNLITYVVIACVSACFLVSFAYNIWGISGGFKKCQYYNNEYICLNKADGQFYNNISGEFEDRCGLHGG